MKRLSSPIKLAMACVICAGLIALIVWLIQLIS